MSKHIPDPGVAPPEDATPAERAKWRRDNERFLTENAKPGVSDVPVTIDSTDKRLQELRREHTKFLDIHSPAKASLWLALQRSTAAVLHSAEMIRRFQAAQEGHPDGDFVAPQQPAIIALGEQLVAAALKGDVSAAERIFERIEGKTGIRQGEEDPDDPEKRKQRELVTQDIIAALTAARIADKKTPGKIIDIEPEDKE